MKGQEHKESIIYCRSGRKSKIAVENIFSSGICNNNKRCGYFHTEHNIYTPYSNIFRCGQKHAERLRYIWKNNSGGSSFFTALNDGLTSALISFLRTLVFQVAAVLIMPAIWGIDGIWYSIVAAELMSLIVTVIFLAAKRKEYLY